MRNATLQAARRMARQLSTFAVAVMRSAKALPNRRSLMTAVAIVATWATLLLKPAFSADDRRSPETASRKETAAADEMVAPPRKPIPAAVHVPAPLLPSHRPRIASRPLQGFDQDSLQQHVDTAEELPVPAGTTQPEASRPPDFEALAEHFSSELRDDRWSSEMDDYLKQTSISAGLDPSVVESTECAATLCRVHLRFADLSAAMTFQEVAQSPAFKFDATSFPTEGDLGVVVYLARSGQEG
jgi:hypothetical protein